MISPFQMALLQGINYVTDTKGNYSLLVPQKLKVMNR